MILQLPFPLLRRIEKQGEESYPDEGAGVLLGHSGEALIKVEAILPVANTFEATQRRRRYQIDARAMLQAETTAEDQAMDVVGIFHSHPDHPAQPSAYDLEHSLPWFSYIITSIEAGIAKTTRAWRLVEDRSRFEEIEIMIQKNEDAR